MPSFIPVSPNASSISRLADISSNEYSGLVDVSIPVYTISLKNVAVPISLTYSSSGVKVDEIASSCGMGWALNAGGVITRTVRGKPDDSPSGYLSEMSFESRGMIKIGKLVDLYVRGLLVKAEKESFERQAADGLIDAEPDLYNYSFPGKSGSFFIAASGRVIPVPYEPLQISGDFLRGMVIIDAYGNTYEFREPESTSTYTRVRNSEAGNTSDHFDPEQTINAIYLTRMVTADNEELSFRYVGSNIRPEYNAFHASYLLAETTYPTACSQVSPFNREFSVVTHVVQQINQKKLAEIAFPNGDIRFNYLDPRQDLAGDYSLSNIIIDGSNQEKLKQYGLKYAYHSGRLFLKEVQEGNDNLALPPYVIDYYNATLLPPRNDFSQDYWGYFNGVRNSSLIPAELNKFSPELITLPATLGYANREPDKEKMKYGVISKIVYPTGGYTTFEFEANTYSKIGNAQVAEQQFTSAKEQIDVRGNSQGTPVISSSFNIDFKQTVPVKYNVYGNQTYVMIARVQSSGEQTVYKKPGNSNGIQKGTDYLVLDSGTYQLKAFNFEEEFIAEVAVDYEKRTGQTLVEEKTGGGIRIYRITHYDNVSGGSLKQKYVYKQQKQDTRSSGVLLNLPRYDYFQRIFKVISCRGSESHESGGYSVEQDANYYIKVSSPPLALNTTKGSFVGYKSVTLLEDEMGENGYTVKEYRGADDAGDRQFIGFPFTQAISVDFKRGHLLNEKIFDNEDRNLVENKNQFKNEKYVPYNDNDWLAAGANIGFVENHPLYPAQNKYSAHNYFLFSEYLKPSVITSITRDKMGDSMVTERKVYYDNEAHLLPTREETLTSKGEKVTSYKLYPLDYKPDGSFIGEMVRKHIIARHIEEVTTIELEGKVRVKSGGLIEYNLDMPAIPHSIFSLEIARPVDLDSFKFSNGSQGILPTSVKEKNTFRKDEKYKEAFNVLDVDSNGNILSQHKANDVVSSFIWGYNYSLPTAEAVNASNNEIFFDSFEEQGWDVNLTAYDTMKSHSGSYSGRIDNPGPAELYARSSKWLNISLKKATKFTYSGWVFCSSSGAGIQISMKRSNGVGDYDYVDAARTAETGKWVFLEREFDVPEDVTALNVGIIGGAGGTVWIDDIRLHPSAAQMISYTYKPLIGLTSKTDVNNRATYYEYDALGRLNIIRDHDRNILKKIEYSYGRN